MGGLALSGDLLRFTNFTRYSLAKFACLRWHTYCLRYCLALSGDSFRITNFTLYSIVKFA